MHKFLQTQYGKQAYLKSHKKPKFERVFCHKICVNIEVRLILRKLKQKDNM